MTIKNLPTYLDDHYTGSVAAIELMDHLIARFTGQPLESFLKDIREDIKFEQEMLYDLMGSLGIKIGGVSKMLAWVTEKFAWARTRLSGTDEGEIGLLQAMEIIFIGVTGKTALWRTLHTVKHLSPPLQRIDFVSLEERSAQQAKRVDEVRLEAAQKAFVLET